MKGSRLKILRIFFVLFMLIVVLTACTNQSSTIGNINDINFKMIDEVQIQTMEQAQEHGACEEYYLNQKQVLDLHKGILYQFQDDLAGILTDLESLPIVNDCENWKSSRS